MVAAEVERVVVASEHSGSASTATHQGMQLQAQRSDLEHVLRTSPIVGDERIDVLHVDDDQSILDLCTTFLEKEHDLISVHTESGVEDAVEHLETTDVDCIVSDYDMPGCNGIEFLEQVRETSPELPFILFTGEGSEDIASEAISKGVTDYLQKRKGTEQYELLANRIDHAVAQRRSEQRAHRIERWLVELAEETNNILWIFTADMANVVFMNSAFEELYGIPVDRFHEDPLCFLEATHPEDRPRVEQAIERLQDGHTAEIEHRVNEHEDYQRWVSVRGQPIRNDDGEVVRIVGSVMEITERKERERQLQQFRRAVESSGHAIYLTDRDGVIEYVNPAFETMTGYTAEEAIGETPQILRSGEHAPAFYEDLWETILDGQVWRNEVINRRKDGEQFMIDQTIAPVTDESGEITHFLAVNIDITEEQATERELAIFRTAIDSAHSPLVLSDPHREDNPLVYVNSAFEDLTGYTEAEAIGRNCRFLQGEKTDPETVARLREAIDNEESITVEIQNHRKNGTPFWNELTVTPVHDTDGNLVRYLGTQRDITDRKERARQLVAERNRIQAITNAIPDVVIVYDRQGRYQEVLTGQESLLLDDVSELVGANASDVLEPDVAETIVEGVEESLDTGAVQTVTYALDLAGKRTWFEGRIAPMPVEGRDEAVVLARDITDQKERTQQLKRQNDRLDKFASVVSHDLRNPLSMADAWLHLAKQERESEELARVDDALDRMSALIDDLLTLARQGETVTDFESVQLGPLVKKCWATVETTTASLVVEIDTESSIRADVSRLKQVFENLIRNATEHGGPDVTVTVGELDDGFYLEDDGPGIPDEERSRILETGYSTAEAGTGFGLSIVDQIVDAHGWQLRITESEAGGARFEIIDVETLP
jgi:PAS domain S-box-containing protein